MEVRNSAKKAFSLLLINSNNKFEVERILQGAVSAQNFIKIKTYIDKEHN